MNAGAPPTALMTTEAMFALPENGTDRELIRGELREKPVTRRNRWHSESTALIVYLLLDWRKSQPHPRGRVVAGEAAFRLASGPDTTVGIDVAYVSAKVAAQTPRNSWIFEGPPVLAVEILSPSDTHEDVTEKIELYKTSGVPLIWIIDPPLQTVLVIREGEEPVLFNKSQDIPGGPELPGFCVPVALMFGD